MPKDEIDYSNTIIYKITCKNKEIKDVYVGHTTNFVQRKHAHKQSCISNKSPNYSCKLYQVIRKNGGWDNWHMEIINFFNCSGQHEAREREQEYFVSLNATLNSIEPLSKNKGIKNPKNIVRPIEKPVFFCNTCHINCINSNSFDKHIKTKKHQKYIKNGTENIVISNQKFSCEKCHFKCYKKPDYCRHLLTTKHKNMVNDLNKIANKCENKCKKCLKVYKSRNGLWLHSKKCKITEEPPPTIPGRFICEICNINTNSKKDYNKHCLTSKHLNRTTIEPKIPTYPFSCKICNKGYNARNSLWYHEQKCKITKQLEPIDKHDDNIKEFKNIILELVKSNTELQKQMLEVCKNSINTQ